MAVSRQDSTDTRQSLIEAGEKLISQRGVDGVSLRQVNSEAGQKNKSAAHYHFGDRQGLLEAIYDYRMERVNQRREAMLEEVEDSVAGLVAAWVYPILEEMQETGENTYYIRFIAKVCAHSDASVRRLQESRHASGLQRIAKGLRGHLPDLPEALFAMRFGLGMIQIIHALAEYEHLRAVASGSETLSGPCFASNLVDMVVAGLQAPISTATRRELMGNRYQSA